MEETQRASLLSDDIDAIREAVQSCFDESFPNGVPDDKEELERQKRDYVSRFKLLAQTTTSHEELLSLVMTSYDLFVDEIDLRAAKTPKQNEDSTVSWFTVRKQDWFVYLVIILGTVIIKWGDDRYASSFAKRNGMERHVFMKVLLPSVLVIGHFFILTMRGRQPTKDAAMRKRIEEVEMYVTNRVAEMEMSYSNPQSRIDIISAAASGLDRANPSRGSFWFGRNRIPPAMDNPPAESTQNNALPPIEEPANYSILNPFTWRR
jgi:hypothetical protein